MLKNDILEWRKSYVQCNESCRGVCITINMSIICTKCAYMLWNILTSFCTEFFLFLRLSISPVSCRQRLSRAMISSTCIIILLYAAIVYICLSAGRYQLNWRKSAPLTLADFLRIPSPVYSQPIDVNRHVLRRLPVLLLIMSKWDVVPFALFRLYLFSFFSKCFHSCFFL